MGGGAKGPRSKPSACHLGPLGLSRVCVGGGQGQGLGTHRYLTPRECLAWLLFLFLSWSHSHHLILSRLFLRSFPRNYKPTLLCLALFSQTKRPPRFPTCIGQSRTKAEPWWGGQGHAGMRSGRWQDHCDLPQLCYVFDSVGNVPLGETRLWIIARLRHACLGLPEFKVTSGPVPLCFPL